MSNTDANRQLTLATIAFALCFAVWGLISGLATIVKTELGLTAFQVSLLVALPVILGSLGRIPLGLLTDRYGGRKVFSLLLAFCIIPTLFLALNHDYNNLLFWGIWLGLAGSSFAVGVGFVSLWFPPEKQGTALGIYGMGNIGQSIAVFLGPVSGLRLGIGPTCIFFGLAALIWGGVFALWARDSSRRAERRTIGQSLKLLQTRRIAWVLSLFYFLTFGGFVAMGVYLPTLLREIFKLTPEDAGLRAAGFIVLATLSRPVGGWLSDRVGGQRVLLVVLPMIAVLAFFMLSDLMLLFTAGALGVAACLGVGNGAVFKLVPQFFPKEVGTVTGLVGAAGGLGGFFPPLVLGYLKDNIGSFGLGFVFLGFFALGCLLVLWFALFRPANAATRPPLKPT